MDAQGYVAASSSSSTSPCGGGVVAACCGLEKRLRSCTCCTNDQEEIVALQKPLAIDLAPHNRRASQLNPNPVPSRASQVDPNPVPSRASDPIAIVSQVFFCKYSSKKYTTVAFYCCRWAYSPEPRHPKRMVQWTHK